MQLSKKQKDPANVYVENERPGQWGMSNLFEKFSKISALFLTKTDGKKIGEKFHCRPVNWKVLHRVVQKQSHFEAFCKDRIQKIFLPSKKSENWIFFR